MATFLLRHVRPAFKSNINATNVTAVRFASSNRVKVRKLRKMPAPPSGPNIESLGISLSNRGYLRPYKPYEPPQDTEEKIRKISSELNIKEFKSLNEKYQMLSKCFEEFQHSVPNSTIFEIKTIDDVIQFYKTPVDTRVPLDALKTVELPENLHIQYDYHRFHPDTDTLFNGQTAFPKSSTIVTGLKYKGKYHQLKAKTSWP